MKMDYKKLIKDAEKTAEQEKEKALAKIAGADYTKKLLDRAIEASEDKIIETLAEMIADETLNLVKEDGGMNRFKGEAVNKLSGQLKKIFN